MALLVKVMVRLVSVCERVRERANVLYERLFDRLHPFISSSVPPLSSLSLPPSPKVVVSYVELCMDCLHGLYRLTVTLTAVSITSVTCTVIMCSFILKSGDGEVLPFRFWDIGPQK